jgi:hypothetical protein
MTINYLVSSLLSLLLRSGDSDAFVRDYDNGDAVTGAIDALRIIASNNADDVSSMEAQELLTLLVAARARYRG